MRYPGSGYLVSGDLAGIRVGGIAWADEGARATLPTSSRVFLR